MTRSLLRGRGCISGLDALVTLSEVKRLLMVTCRPATPREVRRRAPREFAVVSRRPCGMPFGRLLPNKRLKLTAPVICGKIAFVNVKAWRRSLGALR